MPLDARGGEDKMRYLIAIVGVLSLLSPTSLAAQKDNYTGPASTSNAGFKYEDKPLVFHLNGTRVEKVDKAPLVSQTSASIPTQLVISPGTYSFMGHDYKLTDEGLYRFTLPNKVSVQRVVYEKDVDSLLSALSWIHSHGNIDDKLSMEQLAKKARYSKLLITCGTVSGWSNYLLRSKGIKSRLVQGLTLGEWNSYDDGHSLIEVWRDKWNKWVLYDVDLGSYFVDKISGVPMSLIEFAEAVPYDKYEIIRISLSSFDVSSFRSPVGYNFAFIMEALTANSREWYKRVMQVPLIYDDKAQAYEFYSDVDKSRVESYNSNYKFVARAEFVKRFYPTQSREQPESKH
jgi:hypothetical protein